MYTPTKFSTAQDKEKFYKQFQKFVESDFARSKFPKWFYTRLSMTFGHIAHYDQHGFYGEFFTSTKGKAEFLKQTLLHGCYGDPAFTYSDVEKDLQAWVREQRLFEKYVEQYQQEQEQAERAEYARLSAKYA
jgi:hypothetical protein